ncbi:MAG: hypothetical protein IKN04_03055, partial [Clostridia bacterium]|nr:hypothetical protein [Clostridia bacterium]
MKRVIWIVLDSVGAGYLPDAADFGDEGANTLGHIAEKMNLNIPHMLSMGLGQLPGLNLPPVYGNGAYGPPAGAGSEGRSAGFQRFRKRSGSGRCRRFTGD